MALNRQPRGERKMATYEIKNVSVNSWHEDGTEVIENTWLETNRWSDVVSWWKENKDTTASINATLYINGKMTGAKWGFYSGMGLAEDVDGKCTLAAYKQYA
jgi:hypothetical protein